jgi:hypothetical protein
LISQQFKTSKRAWSDSAIRISKDILDIQQNLQKYEDVPSDLRQSLQCLLEYALYTTSLKYSYVGALSALNEVRDALTRIQNESTFQRVVTARDDSARIQIYSNQINRAVEKFKVRCLCATLTPADQACCPKVRLSSRRTDGHTTCRTVR